MSVTIIGESCTKGFMDYELLVQKAEQIGDGDGDLDGNRLRNNRYSIMPRLELNCITGFLLGVDVITEITDSEGRNEYPTIWLWNKTHKTTYTRVVDSAVDIILHQFSLSTSLRFTADEMLGIYQPYKPSSVVRFYYQDYKGQDIYETGENNEYTLDNIYIQKNRRLLIYPETSIMIIMIFNMLSCYIF